MTVLECPHGTEANVHCPQCTATDAWADAVTTLTPPGAHTAPLHAIGPMFELTWGAKCANCGDWIEADENGSYVDDELCCETCVIEARQGKW